MAQKARKAKHLGKKCVFELGGVSYLRSKAQEQAAKAEDGPV